MKTQLPRACMANGDLARLINSDEIQSAVRPAKSAGPKHAPLKKNPLRNLGAMLKLNPYAKVGGCGSGAVDVWLKRAIWGCGHACVGLVSLGLVCCSFSHTQPSSLTLRLEAQERHRGTRATWLYF